MPIAFGPTDIQKVYLGSTALTQVYLGATPLLATGPVTKTWASVGALRLQSAGIGGNERRSIDIAEFTPYIDGVAQLDYTSLDGDGGTLGYNNAAFAVDNNNTTKAVSVNDQRTQGIAIGPIYAAPRALEGFFSYPNRADNGQTYNIQKSDDGGSNWDTVMEFRSISNVSGNFDSVIPIPWQELSGYSLTVRSILCRWPDFTQAEQDAMGQFLTDLETAGVLHFVQEIWPLFASDEATSLQPGLGGGFPLDKINAPTHIPGIGWKFDASGQGLRTLEITNEFMGGYNYFDARVDISSGQNQGASWFLFDADNDTMNNLGNTVKFYIFGAQDGNATPNKFFSYLDVDKTRLGSNLYGGDSYKEGQVAIQMGEPVSLWRKDGQFRYRWYTAADESAGSNNSTLSQPNEPFCIGNMSNNGSLQTGDSSGVRGTYSFFMLYDMNPLTNDDTLAINNAMITMMDSLGIRNGHTPQITTGSIVADAYPQPLEPFEKLAVQAFVDGMVADTNYPISNNRGTSDVYIPALTHPDNAKAPMDLGNSTALQVLTLHSVGTGALPTHVPGKGYAMVGIDAANGGYVQSPKTPAEVVASHSNNGVGFGVCFTDVSGIDVANAAQAYIGARRASADTFRLEWNPVNGNTDVWHMLGGPTAQPLNVMPVDDPVMEDMASAVKLYTFSDDAIGTDMTRGGLEQSIHFETQFGCYNNAGVPTNLLTGQHTMTVHWVGRYDSDTRRTNMMSRVNLLMLDLGVYGPSTKYPNPLTPTEKTAIDTFIAGLRSDGLWPLQNNVGLSSMWIPALTDPVNAVAPLNLGYSTETLLLQTVGAGTNTHTPGLGATIANSSVDQLNGGYLEVPKFVSLFAQDHGDLPVTFGGVYTQGSNMRQGGAGCMVGARSSQSHELRMITDPALAGNRLGYEKTTLDLIQDTGMDNYRFDDPWMFSPVGSNAFADYHSLGLSTTASPIGATGDINSIAVNPYWGAQNANGVVTSLTAGDYTTPAIFAGRFQTDAHRIAILARVNQLMIDLGVYT